MGSARNKPLFDSVIVIIPGKKEALMYGRDRYDSFCVLKLSFLWNSSLITANKMN